MGNWADKLWQKNASKWIGRIQDLNYRDLLIRPNIKNELEKLPALQNGLFIDLGCGDGSETLKLRNLLLSYGYSGELFGIDQSGAFIADAQDRPIAGNGIKLTFSQSSIADSQFIIGNRKANLVFSLFVLQDLAELTTALKTIESLLADNGFGLFVFVHPLFGKVMRQKGALRNIQRSEITPDFEWFAEYPIVEDAGTFYVPYFHRSFGLYEKLFTKLFKEIKYVELKPDWRLLKVCEQQKTLPFCKQINNVYYPEITTMPSSIMVVVSKK